jgi:hypothetical protein
MERKKKLQFTISCRPIQCGYRVDFRSGNLALEKQGLLLFAFFFFVIVVGGKKNLLESVKIITVSFLSFWNLDGYVINFVSFFFFLNPFHFNVVLILFLFFGYT